MFFLNFNRFTSHGKLPVTLIPFPLKKFKYKDYLESLGLTKELCNAFSLFIYLFSEQLPRQTNPIIR